MFRHGETDWNKEGRAQGQTPHIPLNETGINQAKGLAQKLAGLDIEHIYSSPLERAKQTANHVAEEHNLTIDFHENLKELSYGSWEGNTWDEMLQKFPEQSELIQIGRDEEHPEHFNIKLGTNGESRTELGKRMFDEIFKISKEAEQKTFAISTHGAAIFCFLAHIQNTQEIGFVHNCEIVKLEWCPKEEKFSVIKRGL